MLSLVNVIENNGGTTALSGILIVFVGLILIALCIAIFNFLLQERKPETDETGADGSHATVSVDGKDVSVRSTDAKPIPETDLVAIAALIELYRRVHFDALRSDITFVRGQDAANAWRMGYKYGQRHRI